MGHADTLQLTPEWELVTDGVMGGVSQGHMDHTVVAGRMAVRLTGTVSLDNNGGFLQIAFDLADGAAFDASGFQGVSIDVLGNGQTYDMRLRTSDLTRPWQSFRAQFDAPSTWTTHRIPFEAFEPHRTDVPFAPQQLRRLGILAIGREMQADISVGAVRLY